MRTGAVLQVMVSLLRTPKRRPPPSEAKGAVGSARGSRASVAEEDFWTGFGP